MERSTIRKSRLIWVAVLAAAVVEAACVAGMRGQIEVDPENPSWLRYRGGGPVFMAGPGDPEDFLYRGRLLEDGRRRGDQKKLIRKLARTGANSIYLQAVRSHGGDGDWTHNPFIDHDPRKGLNRRVLRQWNRWFRRMDRKGIITFLFIYDDGAEIWRTGEQVGAEERRFIHELVDAFEHHKRLIWVVAEEYQERYGPPRVSRIARAIREADEHDHPIAVHKLHGLVFEEFADDPALDQFAIQFYGFSPRELHEAMLVAWADADGRYNLNMSEAPEWGTGAEARQKAWAVAMAGAYVMGFQMDIANTPIQDLRDMGTLARFMESTDFDRMEPRDDLAAGDTLYVMARPGEGYIAYAAEGDGRMGVRDLHAGRYLLHWLDTVSGHEVFQELDLAAGEQTWKRPAGIGPEAALYLRVR